jgi:type II secretory pathway predicted ATPase ExeA
MTKPTVFISYCHRDEDWKDRIAGHLQVLGDLLEVWDDRKIGLGEDWFPAIKSAIDQARVAILVISKDFLNSPFIKREEVPRFLTSRQEGGMTVIPVIAHPCAWDTVDWLAAIQCYPKDGRALSEARKARVDKDLAGLARKVKELLSQEASPDLSGRERTSDGMVRPPYRGIEPFGEDDAEVFYGRTALTKRLVESLRGRRFLAVLGPSGSGKSSVVRAGLIPALRQGALPDSQNWGILPFKPGRSPLREIATHILQYLVGTEVPPSEIERLSTAMNKDDGALASELQHTARSQILLIIDQFEEIFTQTSFDSERRAFFANLLNASDVESMKVAMVLILRTDFYGRLGAYPNLADRIAARQIFVASMSEDELSQAITGPAEQSGLRFEEGLIEELLREMRGNTSALPLLQQALLELWKRRESEALTFYAYKTIRGVKGAIAGWAESVYKSLPPARQELASRILVELVQPGDGTEDTRRRLRQRELGLEPDRASEIEDVVELLIRDRLLTTDRDPLTQEKLVEIAHEALLHEWPRLREWLERSRTSRLIRDRLQERVKVWQRLGRDPGVLARGGELDEFERWRQAHGTEVSASQKEYLETSQDALTVEVKEKKLFEKDVTYQDTTSDTSKVYFSGVDPLGRYLAPPASLKHIAERLLQEGWQTLPEWIMEWKREHGVDDSRRKPILEVTRPWDLAETGWGVIFAPDLDPRVRSALGELLEHRRHQATRDHSEYYKEFKYRGESTYDFLLKHGSRPGMMADPDHFPYYVLLVGDPHSLPYKFQFELDVNHAVGRICFEQIKDYENYARSVVGAEVKSRLQSRQVVFFGTEHKDDPASEQMAWELVHKLAASVARSPMPWDVREVLGAEARKQRLGALLGGAETPAFLFAACHGVGFGEGETRQEDSQGALVCQDWPGPDDEEGLDEDQWFAAADVPENAVLHGLVAFFYATYGLGTPSRDIFDQKRFGKARLIAPRPLVSRLPQRLLSHSAGGALAVIGHVDRALTPSFSDSPQGEGFGAFSYGLRRLLQGHTVGWSMEYFNQSAAALATMQGFLEEDWRYREEVDRELLAKLWVLRNDARNLMVFGDPAVRLPGVGDPR